jgi:TonB family protein
MTMSLRAIILLTVLIVCNPLGDVVRVLRVVSLEYPVAARHARIQGEVQIELKIDGNGKVESAAVVSGPPALRREAEENIKKWRFEPGRERQHKVTYHFRLEEPAVDYRPVPTLIFDLPERVTIISNFAKPDHAD